jgi:hypothetical protein
MQWRCSWGAAIGEDSGAAGGSNKELKVTAEEKLQWS